MLVVAGIHREDGDVCAILEQVLVEVCSEEVEDAVVVVLWTAKYFGTLYDLNQKGPTYFRSTLDDYQQRFDGFPYLGLFVLVVMVVVGATAGMDGFQAIMDTLESGSFPTVNDVVQR